LPTKKNKKILAIDPGTKEMGVALLEGGRLIYHGVKVIPNRASSQEIIKQGREIVKRLIKDFKPDILVVEKTTFANNPYSSLVDVFADEIRAIGRRKRLQVVSYAPNTVKKFICGNGRASKKELARCVIGRYPELLVYLNQDRKWKERYHLNMFDAVGLGIICMKHR
jgi:Holliday junction resolvasome RuvABC endonuclease subunit